MSYLKQLFFIILCVIAFNRLDKFISSEFNDNIDNENNRYVAHMENLEKAWHFWNPVVENIDCIQKTDNLVHVFIPSGFSASPAFNDSIVEYTTPYNRRVNEQFKCDWNPCASVSYYRYNERIVYCSELIPFKWSLATELICINDICIRDDAFQSVKEHNCDENKKCTDGYYSNEFDRWYGFDEFD